MTQEFYLPKADDDGRYRFSGDVLVDADLSGACGCESRVRAGRAPGGARDAVIANLEATLRRRARRTL